MGGSTGKGRYRRWLFTLNNPTCEGDKLFESNKTNIRAATWQLEKGETTGTLHFQGYIQFNKAMRMASVKEILPTAHWTAANGTQEQNIAYCNKEDTREQGPWTIGDWADKEATNTPLQAVKQAIDQGATELEIAENYFSEYVRYGRGLMQYKLLKTEQRNWQTELLVICGPPGTGKSRVAREMAPDAYYHSTGQWWDGYCAQRVVIMDDFYGTIPFSQLLRLADRYPTNVERKGGVVPFLSRSIIITSNKKPSEWYNLLQYNLHALYRRITLYMWLDMHEENSVCTEGFIE
ncbi:Rep [Bat circovirus]|nr:Rep [Bat circovirus]